MSLPPIGDVLKLMGQMGKLREGLDQAQERAARRRVEGAAGGGLVKATADGLGEILSVTIEAEALKDPESLGPLITAAVNLALRKSREALIEESSAALGGLEVPPGRKEA
jgi:hypothetical protein